jgi:hypothetical protein
LRRRATLTPDPACGRGVRVIESRITRLAYAPEIAQAMLRPQPAGGSSIIAPPLAI